MFEEYMKEVDRLLQAHTGMVSAELPDFCWRDAFEDGVSALSAVSDYLNEYFK